MACSWVKIRKQLRPTLNTSRDVCSVMSDVFTYPVGVAFSDAEYWRYNIASVWTNEVLVPIWWNISDGICSSVVGIDQVINRGERWKGLLNIANGIQLPIITCFPRLIGLSRKSGPGISFVIGMFSDLIGATIDVIEACRELDFEYWFENKVNEVIRLHQIIGEEKTLGEDEDKDLIAQRDALLNLIMARHIAKCHFDPETRNNTKIATMLDKLIQAGIDITQLNLPSESEAVAQDKRIEDELLNTRNSTIITWFIRLASSIGMTLLQIDSSKSLNDIGTAITTAVAIGYPLKFGFQKFKETSNQDSQKNGAGYTQLRTVPSNA